MVQPTAWLYDMVQANLTNEFGVGYHLPAGKRPLQQRMQLCWSLNAVKLDCISFFMFVILRHYIVWYVVSHFTTSYFCIIKMLIVGQEQCCQETNLTDFRNVVVWILILILKLKYMAKSGLSWYGFQPPQFVALRQRKVGSTNLEGLVTLVSQITFDCPS